MNFDLVRFWNFTWQDFYAKIPYDWDVCQIAIICTGDIHIKVHKRFVNEFSTACYLNYTSSCGEINSSSL